jgi:hypothetical protein
VRGGVIPDEDGGKAGLDSRGAQLGHLHRHALAHAGRDGSPVDYRAVRQAHLFLSGA